MAHVFISYKSEDHKFAFELNQQLKDAGFDTWIDKERLRAGEDWREEIDDAISKSFSMVLILSPKAAESKYIIYEFAFARALDIKVIPVMLEHIELREFHPRLEGIQYEDFQTNRPWEKLHQRLEEIQKSFSTYTVYVPRDAPAAVRQAAAALDNSTRSIRMEAIESLAQNKHPSAREVLAAAVFHSTKDVRIEAAIRLAEAKDARAMHGILEAIYDRNFELAAKAVRVMATLGNEGTLEGFRLALKHPDPQIRFDAARTLGQTGMKPPDSVPYLIEALHDEENRVRGAAAQSLGEIGGKQAICALIDTLNGTDTNMRAAAARALGKLRAIEAVPLMISILQSSRKETKRSTKEIRDIVTALRRIGTEEAMNAVERFREMPNFWEENINLPVLDKISSDTGDLTDDFFNRDVGIA